MDVESTDNSNSIRALERGFEMIEALHQHGPFSLTELAEFLELPTSTAHVYLKTLEQEGMIVRDGNRYRNSLQFLRYGGYARQQLEVATLSKQVLANLASQTGERSSLGVEENGQRVLLDLVDGTEAMSDNIPVGEFTDMHWTSLGKCLLAYLPRERIETIIAESPLQEATANTITDPDALRSELRTIRSCGYAIEDEERREGIRSVSVPILAPDESVLGAIGVTGPTNRFDEAQISEYITILENQANIIKLQVTYY